MKYQIRAINNADQKITITFDEATSADHALQLLEDQEESLMMNKAMYCGAQVKTGSAIFNRIKKILSVKRHLNEKWRG